MRIYVSDQFIKEFVKVIFYLFDFERLARRKDDFPVRMVTMN